jgi:NarL family two-component system sensor histidine kinase YdfH
MKKLSPTAAAEVQQERPFFYLLTAVLLGLYILSILGSEMWRQPGRLALFSVLMLIHLAAHWSVFVIQYPPSWYRPYLVLQGILVFPIIYLGGNLGVLFGLYMALIGESVGLLRKNTLHIAIFIAYYILLSLASYRLMIGGNFLAWGLYVLPMALFVSIYVWLYSRQAEARERAQKLAGELEVANRQLSEYAARVEDLSIAAERQRDRKSVV